MTGDVRIENLHIGNVTILPGAIPEDLAEKFIADIQAFLEEQLEAGADPAVLADTGYPVPEEGVEHDDPPTAEEQESIDQSVAEELVAMEADASGIVIKRAKRLGSVARHVTAARRLEGQRRGYASSLSERKQLERRQENAEKAAAAALEEACVLCEFRDDCALTDDIKRWIDTHAYADKAKRRKDSEEVETVESRKKFSKDLEAGVEAGQQIHCDPAKREPLQSSK